MMKFVRRALALSKPKQPAPVKVTPKMTTYSTSDSWHDALTAWLSSNPYPVGTNNSTSTTTTVGTRIGKSNVFWDDFAGTSVDTTKWVVNSTSAYPYNAWWNGSQLPTTAPNNGGPTNTPDHKEDYFNSNSSTVAVSGSNLVLTANDAGFTLSNGKEAWYTGLITTEGVSGGGFQVAKGDYLEAKVLLPSAGGAWPALWTWKSGGNEIDVFEYHPDHPNLLELSNHITNPPAEYYTDATAVAGNTWVTIGALLGATSVDWYVNGTKVYSDGTGVGSAWGGAYINVNLSLSDGTYHPAPTAGTAPVVKFDYVGCWR